MARAKSLKALTGRRCWWNINTIASTCSVRVAPTHLPGLLCLASTQEQLQRQRRMPSWRVPAMRVFTTIHLTVLCLACPPAIALTCNMLAMNIDDARSQLRRGANESDL